jgi:chromate transporter
MNDAATPHSDAAAAPARPGVHEIFLTFLFIGATSFGGGVVAYLRENLVAGRRWVDDKEFVQVMEISQTMPGLNATNMSVIIGDRLAGIPGAVAALVGMSLPGALLMLGLGVLYAAHGNKPGIVAVLEGVAAGAAGLLTATVLQLGRKAVTGALDVGLVIATCTAISVFHLGLVYTLLIIGPVAIWLYRPRRGEAAS